jgi:hypothetical protein
MRASFPNLSVPKVIYFEENSIRARALANAIQARSSPLSSFENKARRLRSSRESPG